MMIDGMKGILLLKIMAAPLDLELKWPTLGQPSCGASKCGPDSLNGFLAEKQYLYPIF